MMELKSYYNILIFCGYLFLFSFVSFWYVICATYIYLKWYKSTMNYRLYQWINSIQQTQLMFRILALNMKKKWFIEKNLHRMCKALNLLFFIFDSKMLGVVYINHFLQKKMKIIIISFSFYYCAKAIRYFKHNDNI